MSEPLVFTPGAAATAFNSVAAIWFVFVRNVRQRWRAGSGARHDPTFWVLYVRIAASVLISQALGRTGHVLWPVGRLWPVVAGLVLIVAGAALRAWSIITLRMRPIKHSSHTSTTREVPDYGSWRLFRALRRVLTMAWAHAGCGSPGRLKSASARTW